MGRAERRKGVRGEREAAGLMVEVGFAAKRNLTEVREGNRGDLDIDAPIRVQVKVGERPPWLQAVREAVEAASDDELPLAMVRVDRKGWYVIARATDVLPILARHFNERKADATRTAQET